MKDEDFKSLDEITPEEFAEIERLARRRDAGAEANSRVFGVGLFTLFVLGLAAYLFLPAEFEPTIVSLAVGLGALSVLLLGVWWMIYRVTEQPGDRAREQLEHLMRELRQRETRQLRGLEG